MARIIKNQMMMLTLLKSMVTQEQLLLARRNYKFTLDQEQVIEALCTTSEDGSDHELVVKNETVKQS